MIAMVALLMVGGSAAAADPKLSVANPDSSLITPTQGGSVHNDSFVVVLSPVMVLQEFRESKVTSPSDVILVFPYKVVAAEGVTAEVPSQLGADFLDADGVDIHAPVTSFYDEKVGLFIMTFGPKQTLSSGLSLQFHHFLA
ncbi:MAG TPA: hypothetical protein VF827_10675, partial [Syntrophales bacterium]